MMALFRILKEKFKNYMKTKGHHVQWLFSLDEEAYKTILRNEEEGHEALRAASRYIARWTPTMLAVCCSACEAIAGASSEAMSSSSGVSADQTSPTW